MAKLTKDQIEQVKALRSQGKKISELMILFKVSRFSILWATDEKFKEKLRIYRRNYRKNNKKFYESQREYQRNYHKKRYNEDLEFKNKHLTLMRTQGIKNKVKALEIRA